MPKFLKRRWEADFSAFGGRRAKAGFQYEAYLPDLLSDADFLLSEDVAGVVTEAESAIRDLNGAPTRLHQLETLARQLMRAESVASSRIEGLELSHRRLAKAAYAQDMSDVTAQSVLANMRAMSTAVRLGTRNRAFAVSDIRAIHRELFDAFHSPLAGELRNEQNWIGGGASNPRDAEFIPPPPEFVLELLEDLCRYIEREDLPAIMQAAIVHAQFETIHPFADGNGRVGRCLIHTVLKRRRVAEAYVPPISLILATDSKAYVKGLTDFRAGRAVEWCALFAQAARTAAQEAVAFSDDIEALQAKWLHAAGKQRADSSVLALIQLLPSHPILDVSTAEALLKRSNQAARIAISVLEGAGILKSISVGRRNRAWEAEGLFELLNSFEARLATRRGGKTRSRHIVFI